MKKGQFLASGSMFLIIMLLVYYIDANDKLKVESGVRDLGKVSSSIINGNLEGEKLKFFIQESVRISKEIALRNVKENSGVYDAEVSNCGRSGDYVVVTSGCDYYGSDSAFEKFFNDSFDGFLREYGSYSSDDFSIRFENGLLTLEGSEEIRLDIKSRVVRRGDEVEEGESTESRIDVSFSGDILDSVERYSRQYDVPEDLVKAIILQESSGRVDAVGINYDKKGNIRSMDYGLMGINNRAHPKFFDSTRDDFVCDVRDSVDCNIHAGTEILRESYDAYRDGKEFSCTVEFYTGWEAALRGYNGWGCTGNNNYVEDVIGKIGGEIEFIAVRDVGRDIGRDVEITNIGELVVDIDVDERVEYDFNRINNVVASGKNIKNCVDSGVDVRVCASRESGFEYVFNVNEDGGFLKFNVEETDSGDEIKFALEIAQTGVVS